MFNPFKRKRKCECKHKMKHVTSTMEPLLRIFKCYYCECVTIEDMITGKYHKIR